MKVLYYVLQMWVVFYSLEYTLLKLSSWYAKYSLLVATSVFSVLMSFFFCFLTVGIFPVLWPSHLFTNCGNQFPHLYLLRNPELKLNKFKTELFLSPFLLEFFFLIMILFYPFSVIHIIKYFSKVNLFCLQHSN